MKYISIYQSSDQSCIQKISSAPRDDMNFPASISFLCDLCNRSHSWRLDRTYSTDTPSQEKSLDDWLDNQVMTKNIVIQ